MTYSMTGEDEAIDIHIEERGFIAPENAEIFVQIMPGF